MRNMNILKTISFNTLTLLLAGISYCQQGMLTVNEDSRIPEMLRVQKELEKENKLSISYTIQLYYGELDQANEVLKKFRRSYSDWPASIEYETPNYKVWAGNFTTRLEAERVLQQIKKDFSSAFILRPDRKK